MSLARSLVHEINTKDPYLVDYLLGWAKLADPQPWDTTYSFAMEIASAYGLIEEDTTLTKLGKEVAEILNTEECVCSLSK